ncbi:MAG: AEC family transporter [Propionibacteriaceae bacterium]|jgi:predicted permease|nr:AEC family transporter [Propionibacteriaceae bacterium]
MGFFVTAQQVVIMFALMAIGVVATKLGWLSSKVMPGLTNILVYFVTPAVILQAFHRPFDLDRFRDFGLVLGIDVISYLLLIAIVYLLFNRRLVADTDRRRALRFGSIYSNAGFLGIPLAQALLGPDGVFFAVVFVVAFNFFVWTHGFGMFPRPPGTTRRHQLTQFLGNPNFLGLLVGLVLFIGSIPLPNLVVEGLGYVAAMNAPLSMIIIGVSLAALSWRDLFADGWTWVGTAVRNLLLPLICLGLLTFVPLDETTRLAILIPLACPVAAFLVMFSVMRRLDTSFATRYLFVSTLMSVITIPTALALAHVIW